MHPAEGIAMMPHATSELCASTMPAIPTPMPALLHGTPRASAWLLGILVCAATPVGVAYLVKQRKLSAMYAIVSAGYWCMCGCLLLLRPTNKRITAIINSLGIATWCVRLGHTLHMLLRLPPQFKKLYENGTAYALLTASSLFQMVLTRCMERRVCTPLCIVYAALFAQVATLYDAGNQRPWWWPLLLHACTQICALVPYTVLSAVLQGRAATQRPATNTHSSELDRCKPDMAPEPAGATSSSKGMSDGPGLSPDVLAVFNCQPICEQLPASTSSAVPAAAAAAAVPASHAMRRHTQSLAPGPGGWSHGHVCLKSQRAAPVLAHQAALVNTLAAAPYKSKLALNHKVCLKLDTQLSCSDLPPDLAQHMQQALCRIGVPALRITDLAVRPGCIMVTLSMRDTRQQDSRTAVSSADQPVIADISPESLTQALLQELQHMCDMHKTERGTPTDLACRRALLQVDKQLLSAVQQDSKWMLTPVDQQPPASNSAPWLGTAVFATAQTLMRSGSTVVDTAVLQLLLDVQMWGLTKLDEVEGWAPPAAGEHNVQHSSSTSLWPAWVDAEASAGSSVGTGAGRSMKLLARVGGGYMVTRVQRVMRPIGCSTATVQVVIELPTSCLVRHHPGGVPSSLVLLNLELWEGEVFLSSSPLISLPQAVTSGAGLNSSAWWWGASEGVVTAAITEMEALACGLANMEQDSLANTTASHAAFVEDVKTWLLGVQATAQACQHCTAAGQQGRQASSQLTPAALKLLGEGLQEYAASIGLHRLHAMLVQQGSALCDWRAQQHAHPASSTSPVMPCGPGWLHHIRVAALGHPCHLCEQRYKGQLREQLVRLQPVSNSTIALYALAATVQVTVKSEVFVYTAFFMPWMLLHVAGAVHSLLVQTQHQQQQQQQQQQSTRSLYWTVPAYALRLLLFCLYASGHVKMPLVSRRLLHMPLAWALTQLVFTLVEQVQCSAVLPTPLVTFMVVCVDLPSALGRASRENGMWGSHLLLAPMMVVVARWVLDAHTRRLLQQQQLRSDRHGSIVGLVSRPEHSATKPSLTAA